MLLLKRTFLFTGIFIISIFILNTPKSAAQSIAGELGEEKLMMNSKVSFLVPAGAKKVGKKLLRKYEKGAGIFTLWQLLFSLDRPNIYGA